MSFRNTRAINTTERFKAVLAIGVNCNNKRDLSEIYRFQHETNRSLLLSSVFNENTRDLLKTIAQLRSPAQMPSHNGFYSLAAPPEANPERSWQMS